MSGKVARQASYRLELLGSFRLLDPAGERIPVVGKRSRILLAMLATSRSGERSRRWLQERLWGSRERANSQASLRRELSNLRRLINVVEAPLLVVRHDTVALDLTQIKVDVLDEAMILRTRDDFLEGIDIAWEEGFEDWLREERQALQTVREEAQGVEGDDDPAQAGELPVRKGSRPRLTIVSEPGSSAADAVARLADLTDNIAERISAVRWLQLVATSRPTEDDEDPNANAKDAGPSRIDYIVECALVSANQARIRLNLTSSRQVLWSKKLDIRNGGPDFGTDLVAAIAAISARIEAAQADSVRNRRIEELDFEELLWRARWHRERGTAEDLRLAAITLARATRANPDAVDLILEKAEAEIAALWATGASTEALDSLHHRVGLARDVDPYDARAWSLLGAIELWRGLHDNAIALHQEALRLNPSLSSAYARLGTCQILSGQPHEGIATVETALRLTPQDRTNFRYLCQLSVAYLMLGDFTQAAANAVSSIARCPEFIHAHVCRVAAHAMAGEQDLALGAVDQLFAMKPDYDAAALSSLPFRDKDWNKRLHGAISSTLASHARERVDA